MIQESINQLLTTAGVAARLSPSYGRREEAKNIIGRAKAATGEADGKKYGLAEIEENLKNPAKEYGETELKDIKNRVGELNRDIYSAKVINTPGHPLYKEAQKLGVSQLPSQKDYHKMLSSIETNLEKRRMALESMRGKAEAAIIQDTEFKNSRKKVMTPKGGNNG